MSTIYTQVSHRYGRLYSSIVALTTSQESPDAASSNPALFSSLLRLRGEVERLIEKQADRVSKRKASGTADDASGAQAATLLASRSVAAVKRALEVRTPNPEPVARQPSQQRCVGSLRHSTSRSHSPFLTLQNGPSALSHPRLQSEMSHWTEAERSRRLG